MNPVVHFELPYKVGIRIRKFYEEVFGWRIERMEATMGDCMLAITVNANFKVDAAVEAIHGRFFPIDVEKPFQYPSLVIAVKRLDEHIDKICKSGGQLLDKPQKIPGIGHYVSFKDPEGNRLSILQPIKDQ